MTNGFDCLSTAERGPTLSVPCQKNLGFLLTPEVDTLGSLVLQKVCYNNAPAAPGVSFRTAHWRCLTRWIQLGQNIQKMPHQATLHDLGRIKPLTLGISSWNRIERFRKSSMSLRSCFVQEVCGSFMGPSSCCIAIWATLESPQVPPWAPQAGDSLNVNMSTSCALRNYRVCDWPSLIIRL